MNRRQFVQLAAAVVAGVATRARAGSPVDKNVTKERMPTLFIGHGSPMNAIEDNEFSRAFKTLGQVLPKPRAILCISAHWYVPGIRTTANEHPETIHDFGGFPKALFDMKYPAPGDPALARRTVDLIGGKRAALASDWGFDHGSWSVLHHLRPSADVPLVQLSIDERLSAQEHVDLGRLIAPLRDEGVLIVGSGNLTHNLQHAMLAFQKGERGVPDWAADFDREATKAANQHDAKALADLINTDAGAMSHPTPDHYYPLLYVAGAATDKDKVTHPITGWTGSLSMRSILFS